MTLVDSTAWVEFFNASGHPTQRHLRDLLTKGEPVFTTGPVLMEVLRGFRHERSHRAARRLLLALPRVPASDAAFLRASDLYRTLRSHGITIRASIDCLIVAIAEENALSVLHNDSDFIPLVQLTGVAEVRWGPEAR